MKYIKFLREPLDGYCFINGLQIADLGSYKDRRIWLCYHHQIQSKALFAIEWVKEGEGKGYDVVESTSLPLIDVRIIDHVSYISNIEDIKSIGAQIAKFIYDMDNNNIRFK